MGLPSLLLRMPKPFFRKEFAPQLRGISTSFILKLSTSHGNRRALEIPEIWVTRHIGAPTRQTERPSFHLNVNYIRPEVEHYRNF